VLSVVIPTLNEEKCVGDAVSSVAGLAEVIVVDGGSHDATVEAARRAGARVLESPRGRGVQLDRGARAAIGEWLVFLHADTRLEHGWADALVSLPDGVVGGAFRFAVDSPRRAYRIIEAGVALRCRLFHLPFGDQGIFVRRAIYGMIGGFPPFPLMEDLAFARRLSRTGRMAFPAVRAFTSARRWEQGGVMATTLRNLGLQALYTAGLSPERLARLYGGHA
jgi:rSAM/selenodomain-associated transferase 2